MAAPAMVVKPSTAAIRATTRKVRAQPSIGVLHARPRAPLVDVAGKPPARRVNVRQPRLFPLSLTPAAVILPLRGGGRRLGGGHGLGGLQPSQSASLTA